MFLVGCILLLLGTVASEQCLAISFSGGGSYGAFEASVLSTLANILPKGQAEYHVVEGISAGSLNTAILSMYPYGSEADAAELMSSLWLNGGDFAYTNWPGGVLQGILFESGIFSSSKAYEYVSACYSKPSIRRSAVGFVNLDNGQYEIIKETAGHEAFFLGTMASCAIPGVYPTVQMNGHTYVDGGALLMMDVMSAINRCFEIADSQEEITIDMVAVRPRIIDLNSDKMNSLEVYSRAKEIKDFANSLKHVLWAMSAYPNVNYRYYIMPLDILPGFRGLNFSKEIIEECLKAGTNATEYYVKNKIYAREVVHQFDDFTIYPSN
ncbi:hypothetical protein SteCoe_32242 [Stentor coeruleus]|uniref:PNPLA domain-containing protein n=1 Tax=Stentor coeruleus TaxID=5963 RepID=A0A1R2AZF0_9CILI|nr:hypothetical protein SteCoe_32242 [Stentor coeruleus]